MWSIQRDELDKGEDSAFGTTGAVSFGAPSRVRFRLYDDDGILYYEGVLDDDDQALNQMDVLKWGANHAGCTTIKVYRPVGNGTTFGWVQEIS